MRFIQMKDKILEFRLEATRDAQRMSRIAFLIATIISWAIIVTTWNAYFPWYTDFPLKKDFPTESKVTSEVQKQVIVNWVESQTISVPILGIKIGVSDGSVFSSIALLIISIWFFLSIRRENHVIGFLLRDTVKENKEARKWIYHCIASYTLFSNITGRDEPIKALHGEVEKHQPDSIMRLAFKVLVFLPPLSITFLILTDILTVLILPAFFRFPHTTLFEHLGFGDAKKLTIMEALAFILLILITILCKKILTFGEYTTKLLREYVKECKAKE